MRTPIVVPRMRAPKSRRAWKRAQQHSIRAARLFALRQKGSR